MFHINCTIYAFYIKKNNLTRDIELIIKYRIIWIPSVLAVFLLRTFTEVKVMQSYFII